MHTFTSGQIFFTLIVLAASFMLIHYTITIPLQRQLDAVHYFHQPSVDGTGCVGCGYDDTGWKQPYPCLTIKLMGAVK